MHDRSKGLCPLRPTLQTDKEQPGRLGALAQGNADTRHVKDKISALLPALLDAAHKSLLRAFVRCRPALRVAAAHTGVKAQGYSRSFANTKKMLAGKEGGECEPVDDTT